MRKSIRLTAMALIVLMLVAMLPLSSVAYGSTDSKLIITHLNIASTEGAGVVLTPTMGETVSNGYNWWMLFTFEWNTADSCYKLTRAQTNANNSDKSSTEIPANGFVYAINTGNDYSGSGGINYLTSRVIDSYNYAKTLTVGTKAYLYNTNIKNDTIDNNGKNWYAADYVSSSYIKMGTPDATGTPYDPNNSTEVLVKYDLGLTHINSSAYDTGMSKIFTKSFSTDISGGSSSASYAWWKVAVFQWDNTQSCYTVSSINLSIGNNYAKQAIIPENGFALAVITGSDVSSAASANMDKIKVGAKAYVYGADLTAGTITSTAKVCINLPDTSLTAFTPTLAGTRLAAPTITNMTEARTLTTDAGFTIQWAAVTDATGYVVNVNNSSYITDGALIVKNLSVTTTSYAIGSGLLSVGSNYTVTVYATGTGKAPSMLTRAKLSVISAEALTSSLRTKTIVAFGDSLTARTGWVNLLGGRFGADVINSGVGGDSTVAGRARFATQVVALDPDIVIINFGMNDQAVGTGSGSPIVPLATYTANLDYFAATLTAADVDVVFATPNAVCTATGYYVPGGYNLNYGTDNMLKYCEAMRKVAIKYGCGIVDINAECAKEDLTAFCAAGDGIHQSTYGHQRYAELIGDYLAAVYDDKDESSVQIKYVDTESNTLATTATLNGAIGSTVLIPCVDVDGYTPTNKSSSYTFTSTAGTVTFQYAETAETISLVPTSEFTIDYGKLYINSTELTSTEVLAQILTSGVTCVPKTGSLVGTGSVIQLKSGDTVIQELIVVVKGDASGDGKITATDYLFAKRHFLGSYTLTGVYLEATDIDGNESITATDYLKIKRHVLGTYNIFA